jgi:hypothetical protein
MVFKRGVAAEGLRLENFGPFEAAREEEHARRFVGRENTLSIVYYAPGEGDLYLHDGRTEGGVPIAVVSSVNGRGSINFFMRGLFVLAVAAGFRRPDGFVVNAGDLAFKALETSDDIEDLPGWVPAGDPTPRHFGATGNNLTADTAGLLAWANYVATTSKVGYLDGIYRCSAELDFTQGGTVPAADITLYGDGIERSKILFQRMGCDKWWVKFNWIGSLEETDNINIRDLTFIGFNSTVIATTSNGICGVNNRRWTMRNVVIQYYGSCALYLTRTFNSYFYNVRISAGGWQYLERADTVTLSITDGSATFSVVSGTLGAGDVGRDVFVADAVEAFPSLSPGGMANQIATVVGSTGTFLYPVTATTADALARFEKVRFTTASGSDVVDLSADVMTADDLGRMVWLRGAVSNSEVLHATITEIIAPNQIRISVNAGRTVTNRAFTCACSLHLGGQPEEVTGQNSTYLNDVKFFGLQIEGYAGAALFLGHGDHAYMHGMKIHGRGSEGNTTWSGPSIINECRNVIISTYEQELGTCRADDALLAMAGQIYSLSIAEMTATSGHNCYMVEHSDTGGEEVSVTIGTVNSRWRWDLMKGVFKRANTNQNDAVVGTLWDINSPGNLATGAFPAPVRMGDARIWSDGAGNLRVKYSAPSSNTDGAKLVTVEEEGVVDGASYIRYSDGTQICWQRNDEITGFVATTAEGALFTDAAASIVNFPVAFISAPAMPPPAPAGHNVAGANGFFSHTTNTTSFSFRCWRATSAGSHTLRFHWIAWGRWK